jgi:site-specific DNA recombinase
MIKDPNCKNKNWKMSELDDIVIGEIRKLAMDPDYIDQARAEKRRKRDDKKIDILEKEIEKIDAQISRFMDLYGIGKFTIDQVSSKVDPLNDERAKLQAELDSLTAYNGELTKEETIRIVTSFDQIIDNGDFNEIRLTIESLIYFIELDNEDITIHWKFL